MQQSPACMENNIPFCFSKENSFNLTNTELSISHDAGMLGFVDT